MPINELADVLTFVPIKEAYVGSSVVYQRDKTPPTLNITAPTSSSSSSPTYTTGGTTYRVSGTVSDTESGVSVVYVNDVVATLSGDGTWYRDITLTADTTTTISVYAIDNNKNQTAVMVRYVRYDSTNPTLNVTAPTSTSSSSPTYTTSSSSYTVKGTVTDAAGITSVTVNGSAATLSGNNWSKAITLTANTTTTVTIVATDKAGRKTTATRYVFYDSSNPSLSVTAPTSTSSSSPTMYDGSTYTVKGTVSDASGITSVTVNGSAATLSGSNWSKSITLSSSSVTTVTVVATDKAGRKTTATRYVKQIPVIFRIVKDTYNQDADAWYNWAENTSYWSYDSNYIRLTTNHSEGIYFNKACKIQISFTGKEMNYGTGTLGLYYNVGDPYTHAVTVPRNGQATLSYTLNVAANSYIAVRQEGSSQSIVKLLAGGTIKVVG